MFPSMLGYRCVLAVRVSGGECVKALKISSWARDQSGFKGAALDKGYKDLSCGDT